jgi:hypothetical protein
MIYKNTSRGLLTEKPKAWDNQDVDELMSIFQQDMV